jgi:chromate transporter
MTPPHPSLKLIFWTFLKIGSTAFGGLMSLIAVVENVIVERMQWLTHEDILDGISIATCVPGAISVNVIAYVGYRLRKGWGTFIGLVGVTLPSFALIVGLAIAYFHLGQLPTVNKIFSGFIPATAAIIVSTAWNMSRKEIKGWREACLALAAIFLAIKVGGAYTTFLTILASGVIGYFAFGKRNKERLNQKQRFFTAFIAPLAPQILGEPALKSLVIYNSEATSGFLYPSFQGRRNLRFTQLKIAIDWKSKLKIALLLLLCLSLAYLAPLRIFEEYILVSLSVTFAGIGVMLFGGAYVGIPLIQQIVVEHHHWLTSQEFAYAIAAGQITPGPIILSAAFIGYKVGGILGALAATVGIYTPPALWMVAGAQILASLKNSPQIQAALHGVRSAVIGTIFAAAWVVGTTAPANLISILIFVAALFALVRLRVGFGWIIPVAGLVGLFWGRG